MRVRPAVISAYAAMMPRIEAERSLARVAEIAAGSGSGTMEPRDQRAYFRALRRAANGGRGEPVAKATAKALANLRIPVRTLEGESSREEFLSAQALATTKKR